MSGHQWTDAVSVFDLAAGSTSCTPVPTGVLSELADAARACPARLRPSDAARESTSPRAGQFTKPD